MCKVYYTVLRKMLLMSVTHRIKVTHIAAVCGRPVLGEGAPRMCDDNTPNGVLESIRSCNKWQNCRRTIGVEPSSPMKSNGMLVQKNSSGY